MKLRKYTWGNFVIATILILWGLLIVYPFYNSILVSFMTQAEYMRKPFAMIVENPTFAAYREIFSDNKFILGYKNTLSIMAVRLPVSVLIAAMCGYALSRKDFFLKKLLNNVIVFTMYFGGGIIPTYLLMRSYGLLNSLWSVIILAIFSVYNMILVKNFFYGIPDSLEESAKLDGASDITIFWKIYLPLAKPIIATITLFSAVSTWNAWYDAMIFISDSRKWPLQLVLREIINNATSTVSDDVPKEMIETTQTFGQNVQMAAVVVTMTPIMMVYPFVQKFFMSGLTVGAVKG